MRKYQCRPAPIAMVNCYFPALVFEANPAFAQRSAEEPAGMHVDVSDIRFTPVPDLATGFAVTLRVSLSWPDEPAPPYHKAWLEAVGEFRLSSGLPTVAAEKHRALSGPSMLYASAREFIKLITLNGPWGGILLPGMVFEELVTDPADGPPVTGPDAGEPAAAAARRKSTAGGTRGNSKRKPPQQSG